MDAHSPDDRRRWRPQLDPCCDYIVFEAPAPRAFTWSWRTIKTALAPYELGFLSLDERQDPESGRRLLVVKLAEPFARQIRQAVEAMRMDADIVVYFYHRTQAAQAPA